MVGTYFRCQIFRRETTGLSTASFKMFPIGKMIKIDRDIGKKASLGCRLVSFRYGDHTLGFQAKGRSRNNCSRLCPALRFVFFNIDETLR